MTQPLKKPRKSEAKLIHQFLLERRFRTQRRILEIQKEIEQQTKFLQAQLIVETDKLANTDEEILEKHKNGYAVEKGTRHLNIKVVKGRRCPSWKSVVIELTSEKYAQSVVENTTPSPDKEIVEVM